MNTKNTKNQIIFVGCSGYGNIGDDTYPIVLRKHLKEYNLIFKNSNPPRTLPHNCGLLVIGPGGVLYQNNNTAHFDYMKEYMEYAIKRDIPLVFLSCGVQKEDLDPWKKYFDYAKLITVRSQKDLEYIKKYTDNKNIHYYPDLCYLFDEYKEVKGLPKKYTVFIPISANPSKETEEAILSTPKDQRILLRMGAIEETLNIFNKYKEKFGTINITNVNPAKVNYIIKNAQKIFTGRYHGMVFSRINGKKYTVNGSSLKILNEDKNNKTSDAINHIKEFKKILNKFIKIKEKRVAIIHDDFSISGGGEKLISILSEQLSKRGIYNEIYTFDLSSNTKVMTSKNLKINRLKTKDIDSNDDAIKRYLFSQLSLKKRYDFFIFSGHSSLCAAYINKPNLLYCHNIPKSEPSFYNFKTPNIKEEENINEMIVNNKDDMQIYFNKAKKVHPLEKIWRIIFDFKMRIIERPILPEFIANKFDAIRFFISRKINIKYYKFITYQGTHKQNLKQINKICVNSINIKNKVLKTYKRDSMIVYPPIEVSNFTFAENKNYWLSINRVVPLKRLEIQLRAFTNLPNERLFIIGDIENKEYYNYLQELKPSNVTFLGVVDEKEKIKLLSECKGFIFTAKDEDFGMSPVEAMASGKPVIAPNEGGCQETIIDKETGILLDDINDHKLYEAIATINKNFDKNQHYYKYKCIEQAKKFDVSIFIEKIISNINIL
jgi:glycosyltransferase involved in cell wall biosynthesis